MGCRLRRATYAPGPEGAESRSTTPGGQSDDKGQQGACKAAAEDGTRRRSDGNPARSDSVLLVEGPRGLDGGRGRGRAAEIEKQRAALLVDRCTRRRSCLPPCKKAETAAARCEPPCCCDQARTSGERRVVPSAECTPIVVIARATPQKDYAAGVSRERWRLARARHTARAPCTDQDPFPRTKTRPFEYILGSGYNARRAKKAHPPGLGAKFKGRTAHPRSHWLKLSWRMDVPST